jgi:hypothetical protein
VTQPPPDPHLGYATPLVGRLLDQLNAVYGGDLVDYLGPNWRYHLAKPLFDAWAHGYAEGFADSDRFLDPETRRPSE